MVFFYSSDLGIKTTKLNMKNKNSKKDLGLDRERRMQQAYLEWKTGKENSLKQLAKKYKLHIPDISRYITMQFELSKTNDK